MPTYPDARDDIRELARICREQADALVRIAVQIEAGAGVSRDVASRLVTIEERLREVDVYFTAQNTAQANAHARSQQAAGDFRATLLSWVAWMTPGRMLLLFGLLQPLLLTLGVQTGVASWAARLLAPADTAPRSAGELPAVYSEESDP